MPFANRLYAEFLGTAWLVLGGCGSAVLAAAFPQLGIGFAGVALAFGLTVLTMVYALGPVSGGHFNPAVTVGLAFGGRFPWSEVVQYVIAQVLGGIAGAAILYVVATGKAGADIGSFATNGFGEHSPGKYGLLAAAVIEIVLTFGFVTVILGATDRRAHAAAAGLAIGLCLTLIHPIAFPSPTPGNPARSTAPALFAARFPALAVLAGAADRRRHRWVGLQAASTDGGVRRR
jgi:aquaporin Z